MQKKSVILISVLPACCSLRALFFTSSWERPSVTATRTLGTFLLMPLSDVNTLSPICFSAAPKAFTRIQTKYHFIVILFLLLTHLGSVKTNKKAKYNISQTGFGVSSTVFDHLKGGQHLSFVVVGVQFELCFSCIAVLHKRHLFHRRRKRANESQHYQLDVHMTTDRSATCMPVLLMTSNAPIMLKTNWRTLSKLSSPMLHEPSIRNTRSALAPLHTGSTNQSVMSNAGIVIHHITPVKCSFSNWNLRRLCIKRCLFNGPKIPFSSIVTIYSIIKFQRIALVGRSKAVTLYFKLQFTLLTNHEIWLLPQLTTNVLLINS